MWLVQFHEIWMYDWNGSKLKFGIAQHVFRRRRLSLWELSHSFKNVFWTYNFRQNIFINLNSLDFVATLTVNVIYLSRRPVIFLGEIQWFYGESFKWGHMELPRNYQETLWFGLIFSVYRYHHYILSTLCKEIILQT